jgi:hypothetical protein
MTPFTLSTNARAAAGAPGCHLAVAILVVTLGFGSRTCRAAPWPGLREALDAPGQVWQTTGWYADAWLTHDGVDAANCERTMGMGSILQTTVNGPGVIEFWWANHFCLLLNNLSMVFHPGMAAPITYECLFLGDWQQVTAEVPPGFQTLSWVLSLPGGSVIAEFPFAAVDEVRFGPLVAPEIVQHPQPIAAAAGEPAVFAVVATGSVLRYQWHHGPDAIAGATEATLTIPCAQIEHAGAYSVVVSNSAGAVTSSNAVLRVLPRLCNAACSNGVFRSSLVGAPLEASVVILASPDLTNWVAVQTNRVTSTNVLLAVPMEPLLPARYFRAMVPRSDR